MLVDHFGRPSFDPDFAFGQRIRRGPVVFEIANQSPYDERFAVTRNHRTVAHTPRIAPGQAAQLQVSLLGHGYSFSTSGSNASGRSVSSVTTLPLTGAPRTGDSDVTQP